MRTWADDAGLHAPERTAVLAFQIELHAKQAERHVSANSSVYCRACLVCSF